MGSFWGFCLFVCRQPPPANPFSKPLRIVPTNKRTPPHFAGSRPHLSEVSKRGWRPEGVGARRSLLCQRLRPLFCALFPMPPLGEGEHNSWDEFFCGCSPVSRQPPPANPFSKPLNLLSNKSKGAGRTRAAGYCPKILLLNRANMVLCPFHRSHMEICTRNRPVSETKFPDDFWGLSRPLCFTAD